MSEQKPMFYTVSDFCKTAGISRSFFYTLQQDGKTPPVTKVRARNFIAASDAAEWQRSITATEEARTWRRKMRVETARNAVTDACAAEGV
jgi:hypothetical protein